MGGQKQGWVPSAAGRQRRGQSSRRLAERAGEAGELAISRPLSILASRDVVALQGTLGNQAVQRIIGRAGGRPGRGVLPQSLQRKGAARAKPTAAWMDAPADTPNRGLSTVDAQGNLVAGKAPGKGVLRIPLAGLKGGNRVEDESREQTEEGTTGRAVALIPNSAVPEGAVDVLLHFHGYGAGYRQLKRGKKDYGGTLKVGELRDVALYQMEQQLLAHVESTHKPMVAVLPQGSATSGFGNIAADPNAYLDGVFSALKDMQLINSKVAPGLIIMSGHSGGGPSAMKAASEQSDKGKRTEVILFDAINSAKELKRVVDWVDTQIAHDVAKLAGLKDAEAEKYLQDQGMRFRGYSSAGLDAATGYARRYKALKEHIDSTIDGLKISSGARAALHANFHVAAAQGLESYKGMARHERMMGGQNLVDALSDTPRDALPSSVTQPPTDVSAPAKTTRPRHSQSRRHGPLHASAPPSEEHTAKTEDGVDWNERAKQDWDQFDGALRKRFAGGLKGYTNLLPLYWKRLGKSPADWLSQLDFSFSFCGASLEGLHPKLVSKLQAVESECAKRMDAVIKAGGSAKFEGAFQPRPVTGKKDSLSDHALGLALHLNYAFDPYIGRSQAAIDVVERAAKDAGLTDFSWKGLTQRSAKKAVKRHGVVVREAVTGETREEHIERAYRQYSEASNALERYFAQIPVLQARVDAVNGQLATATEAKQTELKQQLQVDVEKLDKIKTDLKTLNKSVDFGGGRTGTGRRDPTHGFFAHTLGKTGDPMLQLIKLLTMTVGLQWGGEYSGKMKDLHHYALKDYS